MKKLATLLIAIAMIPALAFSQTKSLAEFHAKYRDMDNTTYVDVSGSLFNFASSIAKYADEDDEDKEEIEAAGRILGAIKSMQVLAVPYRVVDKNDISGLKSSLSKEKFESLMTVKDDEANINIMAQGSGSEIKNLTFLIDDEDEFVLLTFQGTLSMEDVSYLVKNQKNWH
jgi:uncharacterized protein DUF4252